MSHRESLTSIEKRTPSTPYQSPQLERREKPFDPISKPPGPAEEGSGPRRPDVGSPDKENLLERMRKVDPKQAERYRQRTGE